MGKQRLIKHPPVLCTKETIDKCTSLHQGHCEWYFIIPACLLFCFYPFSHDFGINKQMNSVRFMLSVLHVWLPIAAAFFFFLFFPFQKAAFYMSYLHRGFQVPHFAAAALFACTTK